MFIESKFFLIQIKCVNLNAAIKARKKKSNSFEISNRILKYPSIYKIHTSEAIDGFHRLIKLLSVSVYSLFFFKLLFFQFFLYSILSTFTSSPIS